MSHYIDTLKNIGYILAAILGISYDAMSAFGLLLFVDVITGVISSARIHGVSSISSRRLAFGVLSKLLLLCIPLSITLAGKVIGENFLPLIHSAMFVMAVAEAYSIIGNVYAIKTGETVPEFDAISIILRKVRAVLDAATK